MNVYEDAPSGSRMELECVKTEDEGMKMEDECQTLHHPPSVKNPNPTHEPVRSCRIKTVLMIFNTLLLIILILIGLSTAIQLQSAEVKELKASGEELWRLHDGAFYLFWEAEGSCSEALKFCEDRNSRITTMTVLEKYYIDRSIKIEHFHRPASHMLWILSQANGRKLWVNMDSDTTGPLNETLRHCPPVGKNPGNAEGMQGWVCEIRPQNLSYRHCRHYLSRRRYLEDHHGCFSDMLA
ncbi:hypothetical protein SRHO_G00294050 [Serrasalmus rhombeus]